MTFQSQSTRFADYFVICGLDVKSGLEPDQLSGEHLQCAPLDRPFKSKVLDHYPESVPWNAFDKVAVGMLSFPRGLSFCIQKADRQPEFHSFIITREDGTRTYGSAFIYYEEVTDKKILAAMQTLQHMFLAEVETDVSETLHIEQVGGNLRFSPHTVKKRTIDDSKIYKSNKDRLYVTKCLCLITQQPFVQPTQQFLQQLYSAVSNPKEIEYSLESYIYNVLYEVPLPPPGRSMKFYGIKSPIFCQRPMDWREVKGVSELPLFDFCLSQLFEYLDIRDIVQLFTTLLLEHQVLFYSSDYQKLMLVAECMMTLIFPFQWQHVYVPILPASLTHFLDAPVPFVMGLHHGKESRSELTLPSEANMCFVDIDARTVEVPEDLPNFPHSQELIGELIKVKNKFQHTNKKSANMTTRKSFANLDNFDSSFKDSRLSNQSCPDLQNKLDILQQNEAFNRISELAKKTGVWNTIDEFSDKTKEISTQNEDNDPSSMSEQEITQLNYNNTVREIFLNHFLHIFSSYDTFVIPPNQDMESWLTNRESMQNFDKASFLSDQPEAYLPFLSYFTETQMFATFIDNKILSLWEDPEPSLRIFDGRLKLMKEQVGEHVRHTYAPCNTIEDTENLLKKRVIYVDHVSPKPHSLEGLTISTTIEPGYFPHLNDKVLNTEPVFKAKSREGAKWRKRDRQLQHSEHLKMNPEQREVVEKHAKLWLKYLQEARSKSMRQPKLSDMSASAMIQTNWKFVETLLQEGKTKTKRMLVDKMGHEAIELGHGEVNITGVEENTLIASLCDLLERIWSHGLQSKKGKSALWSHLRSFLELEECKQGNRYLDPNSLSPETKPKNDLSTSVMEIYMSICNVANLALDDFHLKPMEKKGHKRKGSSGRIELPKLTPLPTSITHDLRQVIQMSDIRTDVGQSRAFVRLSLEKKVLATHLKTLLSDADLLRTLYKRYAFLRCEDEREQFIYHLLSLNAVDYFCYTNSYPKTVVPYKVMIYPSPKFGCSTTSANPWVCIAGQLGETGPIEMPKGFLEFNVEHKNLGVLTTLRIGHDNGGITPRWLVEYVLVRNELTGHTYRFNCGRWLGKGVDDGSTERLLVAELLSRNMDIYDLDLAVHYSSPPRLGSPKSPKRNTEQSLKIPQIQEALGHAVNNLVKHYYKPEKERGSLTFLLCGERGLVHCLELVFNYGFRSSRLFRNKMFVWDFLEKVKSHVECVMSGQVRRATNNNPFILCDLIDKINASAETIGKDGKFQVFVCVGIRDHTLQKLMPIIANTPITAQLYEESSFLRNSSHIKYLVHILSTLDEFTITLESSLLRGINI
ncbi:DENN domain-containing protein 5B-like isoform X1 [Mytilus californianus]|uniref:DENN domain-containing protein 5B-like isoform X1 n=1 Tax=Mytilus californianus TaxID=6549 RepID=UPI0022457C50|nr:DENN domain-containing protein 5B-like isoform X1 [Mytilus californianus]